MLTSPEVVQGGLRSPQAYRHGEDMPRLHLGIQPGLLAVDGAVRPVGREVGLGLLDRFLDVIHGPLVQVARAPKAVESLQCSLIHKVSPPSSESRVDERSGEGGNALQCSAERVAELRAELRTVKDKIDAAYWTFTRSARGKPPSSVVPEAYTRQREILAELRALGAPHPGVG